MCLASPLLVAFTPLQVGWTDCRRSQTGVSICAAVGFSLVRRLVTVRRFNGEAWGEFFAIPPGNTLSVFSIASYNTVRSVLAGRARRVPISSSHHALVVAVVNKAGELVAPDSCWFRSAIDGRCRNDSPAGTQWLASRARSVEGTDVIVRGRSVLDRILQ